MNRMLRNTVCLGPAVLGVFACGLCFAAEGEKKVGTPIAKIVWIEIDKTGTLPQSAKIAKDDELGEVLKLTRTPEVPQLIELANIEKPAVTLRAYMLRGKVKYAGVGGEGFLEIWNHFPEPKKGAYFSRSMAETGPMGKLRGDSPWKEFVLPFNFDDPTYPMPEKIQFNVYLPQSGTVWLSDLELVELAPNELTKQLSSAAGPAFAGWIPLAIALVVIVAIALGVAGASWMYLKSKQAQGMELRRMQALDIG